jgi:DNA (cytosine-5)-methyltransferase 1
MTLTFGSLFAGIGGMDLGLERAGMVCRWQVEIDDYCRRVLAKHWPDVPRYGDIREVTGEGLERVDLICGGFPCQDISNAGKRAGIDGERSGLWSEYIRLVRVLRPRYVLVENVAALLGRGVDVVLGDLAASGYDAEWDCIPAAAVGAPHLRDRLFILAYPRSPERGAGVASRGDRDGQHRLCPVGAQDPDRTPSRRETLADAHGKRYLPPEDEVRARGYPLVDGGWWATEPPVGRVVDGFPGRVDRLRGLGNAVVPQCAEFIGRRILEAA